MYVRFSQQIKQLLEQLTDKPLSLGNILAETSERGFMLVITLLVLPFLFPTPPGLTGPFGGACLLLSIQMLLGRRSPWLPHRISRYYFPRGITQVILQNLRRLTQIVEKIARPRWPKIARHPLIWRINGLCISWLSLLLMSPVPLTNPLPTIGILFFAIATIESDGLLICVSYVITALITLVFFLIAYGLWMAPSLLPSFS